MAEEGGSTGWDFLTLITGWNFYALPALLLATVLFVTIKNRRLGTADAAAIGLDGRRLVRVVALIQFVLGLHGAILLVQELLTMREMGVTESFANFVIEALSVIVYPLLARRVLAPLAADEVFRDRLVPVPLGHRRARRCSGICAIMWPSNSACGPTRSASKVMPFFLLFVMFLPRVRRVFARPESGKATEDGLEAGQAKPEPRPRWSWSLSDRTLVLYRRCLKPGRRYRRLDRTVGRGVEPNRGILTDRFKRCAIAEPR